MAHSLILGMTESGKTTLGIRLAHHYYSRGWGVIVLDPMGDPRWKPAGSEDKLNVQRPRFFQTSDPDAFLRMFWDSQRCMVFIDEAGDAIGQYDRPMIQTATKGRHWGHSVHFMTQRGAQISPTVRGQCSHLYIFITGAKDAAIHADEWNEPRILEASQFETGEYFHVTRQRTRGKEHLHHAHLFREVNEDDRSDNHADRRGSDSSRNRAEEASESSESGSAPDESSP